MSHKRATILVYRSDRNLWADGALRCRVIDLFGTSGPRVLLTRSIPPTVELDLDLPFDAAQAYGISIDATTHRSGWHVLTRRSFLRPDGSGQREGDSTIVRPMLVHKDAKPSDLTAAFRSLEIQGSPFAMFGPQRFDALRSVSAKLAFLNVEAKLRETRIGTRSLLSYVRDVREVAVDRVFLFMAAELRAIVENSPEFSDAPGHGAPSDFPGLPAHPDSWKHTRFEFGNLQLSFSRTAVPPPPGDGPEPRFSVDCDIDLERDLGHAFEFIHNQVFNKTTDQTLVYRMLWDQGVLPAYQLVPPAAAAAAARLSVSAPAEAAVSPAARAGAPAGRRPAAARAKSSRAGKGTARATKARPAGRARSRPARAGKRRSSGGSR